MDSGHAIRIEAGVSFAWGELPPIRDGLDGVDPAVERLQMRRSGRKAAALASLTNLRHLWLHDADQATIDAAGALPKLELLFVRGLTAGSLEPLGGHPGLRRLILIGGTKVDSLDWLAMPGGRLEVLFLENFHRVATLEPVSGLRQLTAFGFEGGLDRRITIPSLAPLSALGELRYLFLAAIKVADGSLAPLAALERLKRLDCAATFPDDEFVALRRSLPQLSCDWFDMIDRHGSTRAGLAAMRRRWRGGT